MSKFAVGETVILQNLKNAIDLNGKTVSVSAIDINHKNGIYQIDCRGLHEHGLDYCRAHEYQLRKLPGNSKPLGSLVALEIMSRPFSEKELADA